MAMERGGDAGSTDRPPAKDTRIRNAMVAAAVGLFLLLAGWRIDHPGLQYDETLFVNAALGDIDGSFVHARIMGVPVMLMPYIGALKSYIYYPIFGILGTSPATIRWPVILISAASLLLAYAIARDLVGERLGLIFLVLMATDPSFVVLSKLDFGPIVLGTFFRLLAVWAFLRLIGGGPSKYLAVLLGAVALGLFDKLNFIWFVNALIAAALLTFFGPLLRMVRGQPPAIRMASGAALLAILVGFVLLLRPLQSFESADMIVLDADRFREVMPFAVGTIDGVSMWPNLLLADPPPPSWTRAGLLASLVLLSVCAWRRPPALRFGAFFLVLFTGTLAQILVTSAARGPHHMMTLWPWHHMLLCLGAAAWISSGRSSRHVRTASFVTAALLGVVSISQAVTTMSYVRAFAGEGGFHTWWDPAIYALSDAIERRIPERGDVFSVDWGLHTQLQALASPDSRRRYHDAWPSFVDLRTAPPVARDWWVDRVTAPGAVIVSHHPSATEVRSTRRNVRNLVATHHLAARRLALIRNGDGRPTYEVHRLER